MPKIDVGSAITSKLALGVSKEWTKNGTKIIQNVWQLRPQTQQEGELQMLLKCPQITSTFVDLPTLHSASILDLVQ